MAKQQFERVTVDYVVPRWGNAAGEEPGEAGQTEMIQANFTTGKGHTFQRWHLDAISGKPYPEGELTFFQGKWYRPEHLRDEIAEIRKRS